MPNDRGYAVVLVLLILAVISILGSGLMTMSRLDMNFSGAVKNYDMLFNLADGACGMSFNDLLNQERTTGFTGASGSGRIGPLFNQLPEQFAGSYSVYEVLQGYNTNAPPGYELGSAGQGGYYTEDWTGEGHANRQMGSLMVEVAVLKTLKQ
jgi:hypothetical protein